MIEKKEALKMTHAKKEILDFAGAWKDMNEKDFQSFITEVYERR